MKAYDALAFVNYKYFRSSPENRKKYSRAFFYISKKPRVLNLVGGGGRLWVITSKKERGGERKYSLAYKLNKCEPFEVWPHLKENFGDFGVTADPTNCAHYPNNDLTDLLLSFNFIPNKPIRSRSSIGMSIMTARRLSDKDITKLLAHEDKVLHGNHIFISYSTQDIKFADKLQSVLEIKGHSVWRDIRSIVGGECWEPEICRGIENADAVVVIISSRSALSEWVKKEVDIATELVGKPGKLKRLIPLVIDNSSWSQFKNLHKYQKIEESGNGQGIERVAIELRTM